MKELEPETLEVQRLWDTSLIARLLRRNWEHTAGISDAGAHDTPVEASVVVSFRCTACGPKRSGLSRSALTLRVATRRGNLVPAQDQSTMVKPVAAPRSKSTGRTAARCTDADTLKGTRCAQRRYARWPSRLVLS